MAKTPVKVFFNGKEVRAKLLDKNLIEFEAKAGEKYVISN
jgi:hypothetical protein